ncbi:MULTISPECIES: enoyl-CoA hydratase/isomerase family protein [unclassified Nocardioides]|uniref:enoyl-CoA hydratase/isomerase family protein n=1 Tax=unclassified Nocardioides TaxID=2615069 RepID=UPI0006FA8DFD|nr:MULTISPECIES: enoyl-CoA hydratase-related protein [unclassified Nocardioides]KRA37703.1 crotonase [Nocardioides sp. Root614]KRA91663.1 crotonase [Nocardioides sp. Root682]
MTTEVTLAVDSDGVALITMVGADGLNLFSRTTARALGSALRSCDEDDRVRAVVLTGAGATFCAGADLTPGSGSFDEPDGEFSASPVQPAAFQIRKLVIAAINGHAIGIGLTLALQCDLRVVAEDAKIAIPQVRRGMIGDAQSHFTLRRLAGTAVAAEMLLTGRTIWGEEAAARGLANQALPAADVLPTAMDIARDVALNVSPAALALSKEVLWSDLTAKQVADAETAAHRILMGHPDAAEGPAAWRERRTPNWTLRVSDVRRPASPSR